MMDLNAIAYKVENENNKKISAKDLDQAVNNGNAQLSENKEQTKMTQ